MPAESDRPWENCGVIGIIDLSGKEAVRRGILLLNSVQTRGQDAAGILTVNHGFHKYRALGLVKQIFTEEAIVRENLEGPLVIGHTRYEIQGGDTLEYAQPIIASSGYKSIGIAHNGNIPNYTAQKERLFDKRVCFYPDFDSNCLAHTIFWAEGNTWIEKVQNGLKGVEGSYALVMTTHDGHLLGIRDPWGNRPLSWARIKNGIVIASESVAFQKVGACDLHEFAPGEILDISSTGAFRTSLLEEADPRKCVFEKIYLAYETSIMDGETVAQFRKRLGVSLAKNHPGGGEVVTAIPESSCVAAAAYAECLGKPLERLILKDPFYIGRAFMQGERGKRAKGVEAKYNLSPDAKGKKLDAVDDSVVGGTTTEILDNHLLNVVGASEVHIRSSSPPVLADCPWGVNMRSKDGKFVALDEKTGQCLPESKIAKKIGATSIAYLTLEELKEVIAQGQCKPNEYCFRCLGGQGLGELKLKNRPPAKLPLD